MNSTSQAPATEPILSAYEKAADQGIDPRCIPQRLEADAPIGEDIVYPGYSDEDTETWRLLYSRQMDLLPGRACDVVFEGFEKLGLSPDRIPALSALSEVLYRETRWKVARIPGLLHERDFFNLLANRIFPSTDYIRGRHELDYTPAPDMFHDIFGHMPMLTDPAFADFYQLFGIAGLNAEGQDRVSLERFHWFGVEFGLINQDEGRRIFGAGILSSKEEVVHALSEKVEVHPFDPAKVVEQDYEVWHLQDVLFVVVNSFEELEAGFRGWADSKGLLAS
ncbi:MAG: phenylalanine 4-monooxygenase [Bacteroidota bacterium]